MFSSSLIHQSHQHKLDAKIFCETFVKLTQKYELKIQKLALLSVKIGFAIHTTQKALVASFVEDRELTSIF